MLAILIVLPPFLDRCPYRHWRRRPFLMAGVAFVILALVVLTLLVLVVEPAQHL